MAPGLATIAMASIAAIGWSSPGDTQGRNPGGGRVVYPDPESQNWAHLFDGRTDLWGMVDEHMSAELQWNEDDITSLIRYTLPAPFAFCFARLSQNSADGRYEYGVDAPNASYPNVVTVPIWLGKAGSWSNQRRSWLDVTVRIVAVRMPMSPDTASVCARQRAAYAHPYAINGPRYLGPSYIVSNMDHVFMSRPPIDPSLRIPTPWPTTIPGRTG